MTRLQTREPIADRPAQEPLPAGDEVLFADYIDRWSEQRPDRIALWFTDYARSRTGDEQTLTYAELDRWSRAIATRIAELTSAGERTAILTPSGPAYMAAFVGALRSQAIGVPLFEPDHLGQGDRLRGVLADCRPACVLTTASHLDAVTALVAGLDEPLDAHVVAVDELAGEAGAALAEAYVRPVDMSAEDLAYLQYTSGSTRAPAGVELTHRNLVANALQLIDAFGVDDRDYNVGVSWLPLFHDMGLLLGIVVPLVCGGGGSIFDPLAFIQRPVRWLRELGRHECSFTAAPNFAFGYAAKRVRATDREQLDLSPVRAMLNGAEPVQPRTMRQFLEVFTPHGLRPEALRPSYGLAEATVFVSTTPGDRPARITAVDAAALQEHRAVPAGDGGRTAELVSCGVPVGQRVAIADAATGARVADGTVGEVWVHGPNVGAGYWDDPAGTAATFGAVLQDAQELPAGGWLRTGDLGVLLDGELYITGRIKDTIIIDGRNVYPNDVEATVEEAHDAIAAHRLAAFSVATDDGEGLVVVAEQHREADGARGPLEDVAAAARRAVSVDHAVALHDFVLVEPHTIPRTSSGKIARQATRERYLDGTLQTVGGTA